MDKKDNTLLVMGIISCTIIFIISLAISSSLSELIVAVFMNSLLGCLFYLGHKLMNEK